MRKPKKLTYSEIRYFASVGKFDKIPQEYTIKWIGNEPGVQFLERVERENITLEGNAPPLPTYAVVEGSHIVSIPMVWEEEDETKVEFGDVYLKTDFRLSKLNFVYEAKDPNADGKGVIEYLQKNSEGITIKSKKDVLFNIYLSIPNMPMKLYNAMLVDAYFHGFDPSDEDDNLEARAVCEYLIIS